jgi:hypothetical protein
VLGKEHISRDEWIRRVQQKNQKDIEEERQRVDVAEDHPMSKLMISFYFKGGQPEQGCEFAHKSFREYLFAECIVETLKDYGRKLEVREVERMRLRNYWRDFSPSEDRPRYKFSRALAELLAPQWLTPEVLNHLESLIAWEIARAKEKTNKDGSRNLIIESLGGLPTQSLDFERWKWVRDGFADMWHWWCDGAHLRPQVRTERWKKSEIERTYVDELIRWAAPLAIEEDENLQLESATSIDAHLGDALCQICAMVHFFIARNEGWDWREPSQVRFVESEKISRYQIAVSYREVNVRLFAPGCISTAQENISRKFTRYIARINAAFGRPRGDFPGHTFLNGAILFFMDLDGARFVNASLVGTRFERGSIYFDRDDFDLIAFGSIRDANLNDAMLEGAVLDCIDFAGANMSGATLKDTSLIRTSLRGVDLSDVHFLTREQIESALIDEYTKLPEDLEIFKPEILERQRQQEEELEEEMRTLEMEAGLDPGYEPEF